MITEIFSVRDSIAQAFMPPFTLNAKGQAIRGFSDAVNNPQHAFAKNPGDYTLYHLGSFDDCSGLLITMTDPERVVSGLDVLQSEASQLHNQVR